MRSRIGKIMFNKVEIRKKAANIAGSFEKRKQYTRTSKEFVSVTNSPPEAANSQVMMVMEIYLE